MKTDELIAMLATNAGSAAEPVRPGAMSRFTQAMGWGAFGATLLMALLLGVRPDIADAAKTPMFWLKLAFPLSLSWMALLAATRLARPGAKLGRLPLAMAAPVAVIWLMALASLAGAGNGESRADLVYGDSWAECPINIALLSVPMFAGAFWAMRSLAPVQPVRAGAVAGLLAGAVAASAYALHCPEMAPPFLAIWYVAGMLIPAAVGALIAPKLLRW
jgi:hypothetical protein